VADLALAGYAVHDLLVERDAGDGWERHLRTGVAFEQRRGVVLRVERLDGAVDLEGAHARPGHLPTDSQRLGHELARLAHQPDLAAGFQFRMLVLKLTKHLFSPRSHAPRGERIVFAALRRVRKRSKAPTFGAAATRSVGGSAFPRGAWERGAFAIR